MQVRGVMIPALDPNPGLDFQLFVDSGSSKKRNSNNYKGVTISAINPYTE